MKQFKTIHRPGILNSKQIIELIDQNFIRGWNSPSGHIDGSALDLHVSDQCWKLPAGIKCRNDQKIEEIIQSFRDCRDTPGKISPQKVPDEGLLIQVKDTYLIKLRESIDLPPEFFGQGTGKSSIGRLDVLTRLLADDEKKYDSVIQKGHKNLYVEVTPLSFPILVSPSDPIYQLRISYGKFENMQIQGSVLRLYSDLFKVNELSRESPESLSLNLEPCDGVIALKAKRFSQEDNIQALAINAPEGTYDPEFYWDRITMENPDAVRIKNHTALRITQNAFYILRSKERFYLPNDIAVYALAMTEEVGELRIHHAGFVHPGFGTKNRNKGTPLIFEVRGHDIDMYLMDGDLMAELKYYPMSKRAINPVSPYEEQELKPSKIFKNFKK